MTSALEIARFERVDLRAVMWSGTLRSAPKNRGLQNRSTSLGRPPPSQCLTTDRRHFVLHFIGDGTVASRRKARKKKKTPEKRVEAHCCQPPRRQRQLAAVPPINERVLLNTEKDPIRQKLRKTNETTTKEEKKSGAQDENSDKPEA